jgi:hypothetical protein
MSRIFGVHIQKVRFIEIDRDWNSGGYVELDPIQNSFLKPFLIAVAPSLINTISACLLILIAPYFTEQMIKILIGWFIVSFILQSAPSRGDLSVALRSLFKYPRSSLTELGCLTLGLLAGLLIYRASLVTIGVELPPLLIAVFSLIAAALAYMVLT